MIFEIPDTAEQLRNTLRRWIDAEIVRRGSIEAWNETEWRAFLEWELLSPDFGDHLHRMIGLMETARAGLLGPVLEAYLAVCADQTGDADAALHDGKVVTSVAPTRDGPVLVGWGGVADLVFDHRSGVKLASAKLPLAKLAYPVPHGWLERPFVDAFDPLQAERWFVASALIAGIIEGALELTAEHVLERQQFGKSLASFQAVQFPLAELKVWSDGVRLCALDSATKRDRGDDNWELSSALSWLNAVRAAERTTKVCHQSFGALGFCNETGLVQLTSALTWLRLSVGVRPAQEKVLASRRRYLEGHYATDPGCLVLEGSAV